MILKSFFNKLYHNQSKQYPNVGLPKFKSKFVYLSLLKPSYSNFIYPIGSLKKEEDRTKMDLMSSCEENLNLLQRSSNVNVRILPPTTNSQC